MTTTAVPNMRFACDAGLELNRRGLYWDGIITFSVTFSAMFFDQPSLRYCQFLRGDVLLADWRFADETLTIFEEGKSD